MAAPSETDHIHMMANALMDGHSHQGGLARPAPDGEGDEIKFAKPPAKSIFEEWARTFGDILGNTTANQAVRAGKDLIFKAPREVSEAYKHRND